MSASEIVESIRKFMAPFTEPVLSELGLYVAEKIQFIRFRNSVNVLIKATELLQEKGLNPSPVKAKILVPLLEGAGLEEEDSMIDLWAQLLASASEGFCVTPAFPTILSQLTGMEAAILDWIWSGIIERQRPDYSGPIPYITVAEIKEHYGLSKNETAIAIDNLIRLRLLQTGGYFDTSQHDSVLEMMSLSVTALGNAFMKACTGQNKDAM